MKYLVKTVETEIWNRWYEVEADSADEANRLIIDGERYLGNVKDYDERFEYTDEIKVEEIELFNDEDLQSKNT